MDFYKKDSAEKQSPFLFSVSRIRNRGIDWNERHQESAPTFHSVTY